MLCDAMIFVLTNEKKKQLHIQTKLIENKPVCSIVFSKGKKDYQNMYIIFDHLAVVHSVSRFVTVIPTLLVPLHLFFCFAFEKTKIAAQCIHINHFHFIVVAAFVLFLLLHSIYKNIYNHND